MARLLLLTLCLAGGIAPQLLQHSSSGIVGA
jgi:hypothetical protein